MKTLNSTILMFFMAIAMTFTACTSEESGLQENTDPITDIISEEEAVNFIARELKCHTANIVNFAQERLAFAMSIGTQDDFMEKWCGKTVECDITATYIPHDEEPNTNTKFENGKLEYTVVCNPFPVFDYKYSANDVIVTDNNSAGNGEGVQNANGTLECDDVTNPRNIVVNTDNVFTRVGKDNVPDYGALDTELELKVTEPVFVNAVNDAGEVVEGTITKGAMKYEVGFVDSKGVKVTTTGDVVFMGNKQATVTLLEKEYIVDWTDLANPTFEVKM